jgi:uncharacterized membrane protein YjgN (DUF898 family)
MGNGTSQPFVPEPPEQLTFLGCQSNDSLRTCILKATLTILKVLIVVALAVAAVMIAWAGFEYIYKSGKAGEKEVEPKNRIIFAAVGLVIAFLAWALSQMLAKVIVQPSGGPQL